MSPLDQRRVYELFVRVCDALPEDQEAILEAGAGDNPDLVESVRRLLVADSGPDDLLADDAVRAGVHRTTRASGLGGVPSRIGPFDVVGVLGEGGMGIVYEATQASPHRRVAVKVLRSDVMTERMRARFQREAEVLGLLQHPGIAQVFEAGLDEGRPYIAMELVDGSSLIRYAADENLDTRARCELVARIADATHHAHQKGVVHRDLKPDNIIVVAADESTSRATGVSTEFVSLGQPKILDFGIARAHESVDPVHITQTAAGQVLGTLAYMSPEQINGSIDIDTRSDVFTLGMIAYELLTGSLPQQMDGASLADALSLRTREPAQRLGLINRKLAGDIETIVSKAMHPDRTRRYQSAAELAADIRRHLHDQPIEARPPSVLYQFSRFQRRNRALVVAGLVVLCSIVVVLVAVSVSANENRRLLQESDRLLYLATVDAASDAAAGGNIALVRSKLAVAPERLRGWEWDVLSQRSNAPLRRGSLGVGAVVPRSPRVWIGEQEMVFGVRREQAVFLVTIDMDSLETVNEREVMSVSQDADIFAAVTVDPFRLWTVDVGAGRYVLRRHEPGSMTAKAEWVVDPRSELVDRVPLIRDADFVFAPIASMFVGSMSDAHRLDGEVPVGTLPLPTKPQRTAALVSLADGRVLRRFKADRAAVAPGMILEGGTVVGAILDNGHFGAFDIETGETQADYPSRLTQADVTSWLVPKVQHRLVLGTANGQIYWLDTRYGEFRSVVQDGMGAVRIVAERPGYNEVIAVDERGGISVWPASQGDPFELHGHDHWVESVALADDGGTVLSGDWEGSIRAWDAGSLLQVGELRLPSTDREYTVVHDLCVSADDRRLLVTSSGGSGTPRQIDEFDRATGALVRTLATLDAEQSYARYDTSGRIIVSASVSDVEIAGWADVVVVGESSTPVVFSPVDADVAVVSRRVDKGYVVDFIDLGTMQPIATSDDLGGVFRQVAFSPDGARLAVLTRNRGVHVLDTSDAAPVGALRGHSDLVLGVAWSPDGAHIATASRDGTVGIWDARSLEVITFLRGHRSFVNAVEWSPDGRRLYSVSSDRSVRVWSAESAAEVVSRRKRETSGNEGKPAREPAELP